MPLRLFSPYGKAFFGMGVRARHVFWSSDRFRHGGLLGYAWGAKSEPVGGFEIVDKQTMETGGRVRTERRLVAILAADKERGLDRLSSTRAEGLRVNRCAFCSAAHEHE